MRTDREATQEPPEARQQDEDPQVTLDAGVTTRGCKWASRRAEWRSGRVDEALVLWTGRFLADASMEVEG